MPSARRDASLAERARLRRLHLALDDVEDGNVFALLELLAPRLFGVETWESTVSHIQQPSAQRRRVTHSRTCVVVEWLSRVRTWVETMMFLVWSRRRITSSTVVLRTLHAETEPEGESTSAIQDAAVITGAQSPVPWGIWKRHVDFAEISSGSPRSHVLVVCRSIVSGVYPVMRKWQRGVGMSEATRPTRSLFMYPG